ncbi:hypothetical protein JOC75_004356 [Metabacillus crassostreae]|nr:hypothetical protein [Metabacillus crassostreae]MBM7606308.1 hypothetical protein [Metabacillus crassostreae]
MTQYNYKHKKKKEVDGKKGMDDDWVPGCVDLFVLPLQIVLFGHYFLQFI